MFEMIILKPATNGLDEDVSSFILGKLIHDTSTIALLYVICPILLPTPNTRAKKIQE